MKGSNLFKFNINGSNLKILIVGFKMIIFFADKMIILFLLELKIVRLYLFQLLHELKLIYSKYRN